MFGYIEVYANVVHLIYIGKNCVVHSNRSNHTYLNPLPDSLIRSVWYIFADGSDEE